jgi:hypothetical protein
VSRAVDRALGVAVALAILAAAAVAHAEPDARTGDGVFERAQVEVGPAHKAIGTLTIDNPLGDVRVEGHDAKTVQIIAVKRAPDDDTLDRLRVSLVPDPDGAVHITTAVDGGREAKPVMRGAVRIDLVIRAPRDARVEARVRGGTLALINMDAGGELDAGDGAIAVENVSGTVFSRSLAGAQHFKTVFGTVDAMAVAADLDLDTVRGERLVAAVHVGRIRGRRISSRHVELRSTRGDIALDAAPAAGGELVVASLRGDVAVTLHGGMPVRVHAQGAKVSLPGGGASDPAHPDQISYDNAGGVGATAHPAFTALELRSSYGTVTFALAP